MAEITLQGENGQYVFDPDQEVPEERKGGMGIVYWGNELASDKKVAIKVIYQELAQDQANIQRARSEANVKFDHPNLLKMLDFIEKDGIYHIVSERLEGKTLEQFLQSGGAIKQEKAIKITIAVLNGLQALHNNTPRIIHRDIKPSNIFITSNGSVKLMDFGIAKISGDVRKTKVGTLNGTPHYAPPEQIRGEQHKIGITSDIYSVGIVLYEMLTSKPPFDATNEFDIQKKHIEAPLPPHSSINEPLFNVIRYATRKKHDLRISSAAEFKNKLRDLKDIPTAVEQDDGWRTAGIIFIFIAIILGIVAIYQFSQKEEYKENNSSLISKNKNLESDYSNLWSENKELKDKLIAFGSEYPIKITDMKFGSVDENGNINVSFKQKLYKSNVKYLKPRITYNSLLNSDKTITLYLKIIKPDGSLSTGKSSPIGYSTKSEVTIKGKYSQDIDLNLTGWGTDSGGSYNYGRYRFEVWYEGKCLGYDTFYIYY